ncbi:ABC transporter permease [Spiractinospora alimapuensis]|uniref:ABC transporter permease n=1 Tax=Spiractinospora alimapuensis TaxID=2820884 RepID=UPI001F1E4164|nr:ABC transporter permease [Spiractinospora alimapuensis]QVQ53459.1 ABC transporter permease [Spiractinospora alimapuensis]
MSAGVGPPEDTRPTDHPRSGPARRPGRRVNASLAVGTVLVGLVVLVALVAVVWTPHNPVRNDAAVRLLGPGTPQYWLGTDKFGRDVVSQLMAGARVTLLVGVVAVGIAAVVGTPVGILAGMTRRRVGEFLMRVNDLVLAFPALLMAIMFGAVFGASTVTAMVAIGVATVPSFARIARGATLQVLSHDYVQAARAAGRRPIGIAVRHVLPNISSLLIVQCSVSFAIAILAEAALSFLGFGTRPPTPSWGRMLRESQEFLFSDPALVLWPGLAIALAVLGFNLLGDGLRDRLDPRLTERGP